MGTYTFTTKASNKKRPTGPNTSTTTTRHNIKNMRHIKGAQQTTTGHEGRSTETQ